MVAASSRRAERVTTTAAEVRAGLGHPVIDADGHGIEYLPWFRDLLRDEGGPGAVDAWDVVENGARLTRALDADAGFG